MGRRGRATRFPVHSERWRAVQDGAGRWHVVNEQGAEPLRSADALEQAAAVHLAAAAPELRDWLAELLERFAALESPYTRDARLLQGAWGAVVGSRLTGYQVGRALQDAGQLELDLNGEQVA